VAGPETQIPAVTTGHVPARAPGRCSRAISHKIHVAQWRSTTCRPTLRLTDPTNGRLAPSRCQPPCLDPYSASLLAWTPTLLMYIWIWSLPSSMLCSSSICLPSVLQALQFRSSWPLRTLVAPLGSPLQLRPPVDHISDRLAPVPGHTS
jgi:hypothetical protein